MTYYTLALIGSFSFAFEILISKYLTKYSVKNIWLFNFLYNLFSILMIIPLNIYLGAKFPEKWLYIFLGGMLWAIGNVLFAFALYNTDISVLTPLFNLKAVVTTFLGIFLLHEFITSQQILYITIIIISSMFVTIDERLSFKSFFNKWVLIIILEIIAFSFSSFFVKKAAFHDSMWTVNLWVGIISMLCYLPTFYFFKNDIKTINFRQIKYFCLIGLFGAIGFFTSNIAYQINVSISSVIMAIPISMFLVMILSLFKRDLLEYHSVKIYSIRFIFAIFIVFFAAKLILSI